MAAKTKILSLILALSTLSFPICYSQTDTLQQGQQLRDWQILTSQNSLFRMQFFSLGNSPNRYLGIFYNTSSVFISSLSLNDQKAVWVANRNTPIIDASGNLEIDTDGSLKLFYGSSRSSSIVLSSVTSTSNLSATLMNNGDFVLREMDSNGSISRVIWESFDYPTDTLLPGMKLGINFRTGHVWSLTSWMSDVLPSSGSFRLGGDPNNTTQLIIWWRGNIFWMSGPWGDGRFENIPRLSIQQGHEFTYVSTADENYFMYSVNENRGNKILSRYTMDPDGYIEQAGMLAPFVQCFWNIIFRTVPPSQGCEVRRWPECRAQSHKSFVLQQGRLREDGFRYSDSSNMSLFDCETACYNDCSCIAYSATSYNKTGCTLYGQGMIFQRSRSSLDEAYILREDKGGKLKLWVIGLFTGLGALFVILLCCLCCCINRRRHKQRARERLQFELESKNTNPTPFSTESYYTKDEKMSQELQSFSFQTIASATNNFDTRDKLGEGGFGPVYKGRLVDGKEVAIKRLARSSGQGLDEFKNEILLIAKLQHTNLVRLLGCCIQGEEKILVYEYMPNKSLDYFLFKPGKKELLKWPTRYNIIEGVAQGLLYLHKYSRLRIIHRDLKASNILLDENFNPKISDFGMARIFGINESEANTNRVVGTYGYMSPEYAMNGIFSVKSDVYSFGVLLLEIVSSKKNNSNYHSERQLNLIGLAWELWNEGRAEELIDAALDNFSSDQALRCIHVSLLCAQDSAIHRPSMSDVISMLKNKTMPLPAPKQPAFFIDTRSSSADDTSRKDETLGNHTVNGLTISMMQAR